jgi:Tol biopolymer transport system component/predicted Ser/Thr protein kinase
MDLELWQRIEELYHSALERAPSQRGTFLTEACQGDDKLRGQVEALLSQSDSTDDLVRRAVWEAVADMAQASSGLKRGTRFGPYEILNPFGEGGMGKVYSALDTRLDRVVAIKVSTEQFSARFEHEARAISAMNHPNICTLYDVGPNFLVMELVEGETLAERLDRGWPLPAQEMLDISLQIAEALEAAHRKGIVHRDLKPANVKVTPEGRVKVLDFGLAKTVREELVEENASRLAAPIALTSVTGQVLGTPAYMSPEQARGRHVDTRTDVWAYGCLLYELLTGNPAFQGENGADSIAAILEKEPDWQALPSWTPATISKLLRQCLEKDADRRVLDIRAARTAIENAATPPTHASTWGKVAATGALVVAAILATWFVGAHGTQPDGMIHAVPLTTYPGTQDSPSFSPDGSRVAFAWDGEKQDNFDIYVKRIGPGPPVRLTRDPAADTAPAWSPDGSAIAFLRDSRPGRSNIVLIPPSGGPERVVAEVAGVGGFRQPLTWLPDGKWLIVVDHPSSQVPGLWLVSAVTGERRQLTRGAEGPFVGDFGPAVAPDGRSLAFVRETANNSCDLYLLTIGGDLRPRGVPRRLTTNNEVILGLAWTADSRELIYASGAPGDVNLFRISAFGSARPRRLTEQHEIHNLTISRRTNRLVFVQSRRELDIYRLELSSERQEFHRSIPLIASSRLDRMPRYSPDGKNIAFVSLRSGNWQLWMSDSEGANPVQMTSFTRGEVRAPSWSADGRQIGFLSQAEGSFQAYTVDVTGGSPRKLEALGTDTGGWIWSRDGRWIFFASTRGGSRQLWRVPASGGAPQQWTRHGAMAPVESEDQKLLYYVNRGGIWSVPVEGGDEREVFKLDAPSAALEPGRSGIYFASALAFQKPGDLMYFRLPGGPMTKIPDVQTQHGLSLSPDQHYLLYTKMTSTGSDLMVVENFR